MASDSGRKSFSGIFGSSRTPEEVRRRFFEAPMDASVPAAIGSVLELAGVLTKLPDVFIASQNRELERVRATAGENDPRVQALQASIEQADEMRTIAQMGQSRVQRVAMTVATGQEVFHGFVSNPDLTPVVGVTVRLGERQAGGRTASATTDDDGYFSIALAPEEWGMRSTRKRDLSLSQRINRLFETRNLGTLDTPAAAGTNAERDQSRESIVQILRDRQLIHEDPIPVELDGAAVYREYVITEQDGSESDFNEFLRGKAADLDNTQTANESGGKKSSKK
jgi:hypothetical protein